MSGHVRHSSPDGPVVLEVTPQDAGWGFSGLRVVRLAPGEAYDAETGDAETLVLSLSGSCRVRCGDEELVVAGRPDVFAGPSDFVYVPRGAAFTVTSDDGGRFALASARCERTLPLRHADAADVPVELRGAGSASRQVHNLCLPDTFEADRLIVCEVLTPAGNWSSYPPHKHDEQGESESALEEIYYFEVADGPGGPGIGYQRVYGHDGAPIDELVEVRTGDVVLIPYGWHGPSMAAPGYDLYYLNVMAGPGEDRAWLISDDPQHAWVRETWTDQAVDPRLPMGGAR
ncbi:5-deoxy-glucuronate isomerase [Mumia quercus]|uniref:5-deoxy-glucuronate isomerase n=1 Tax=Mumia quercus TaxID=2976125 RepID=UPI0021D10088|nr:5-deoxy-glucuronate isomerase [Mumia quercus]